MERVKCLVIGSGPSGYTAAIYPARENLSPVVIEGMQPGGQLPQPSIIENFPGFPNGITGFELMDNMRKQAVNVGADVRSGSVVEVDFEETPYKVTLDDGKVIECDTVIVATGATAKYLGIADEAKYQGKGVSACATCDGFFFRKKIVAVVGGGDTACEEANYLASLAAKVYLIVRKPYLRASKAMQDRTLANPKIEVLFEHNTEGLFGENKVEGVHLVKRKGEADEKHYDVAIAGFFLAIGPKPNSDIFKSYLEPDETGYFVPGDAGGVRTVVPGVFVAGDVADPHYRQAITAAASGCKAAMEAERYLSSKQ